MYRQIPLAALYSIALFAGGIAHGEPEIHSLDPGWHVDLPVYVTALSFRFYDGETTTDFQTLAASAEVLVSREGSPWSASLFVDRRISNGEAHDDAVSFGAGIEYATSNWDTNAHVINSDRPGNSSAWFFGSRTRYRFRPAHKVGLEVFGGFDDPSASYVLLGYYGSVTPALSIRLALGTNIAHGHNYVARTSLVWQLN